MSALRDLVAEELATPVDPRVTAMAAGDRGQARARVPRGPVLRLLPAAEAARRADARLLPDRLGLSLGLRKRWLATANRLIPPNVFYFEHDGLVAKYAVLSEADFRANAAWTRATSRSGRGSPSPRGWSGRRTMQPPKTRRSMPSRAAPTLLAADRPA